MEVKHRKKIQKMLDSIIKGFAYAYVVQKTNPVGSNNNKNMMKYAAFFENLVQQSQNDCVNSRNCYKIMNILKLTHSNHK